MRTDALFKQKKKHENWCIGPREKQETKAMLQP